MARQFDGASESSTWKGEKGTAKRQNSSEQEEISFRFELDAVHIDDHDLNEDNDNGKMIKTFLEGADWELISNDNSDEERCGPRC